MKLAVVTPRFGTEVAGGAESAARLLTGKLAELSGWSVEALTTCAVDSGTWANEYPSGTVDVDGILVHRFANARTRIEDFDRASRRVLHGGRDVTLEEQRTFFEEQGPFSPELIDAIRDSDADVLAFHPYLFHPTAIGLSLVADRAVLHPAAHDEAALRLPIFRDVFLEASALAFWSQPERRLVQRRFSVGARRQAVLGLGVEAGPGDVEPARATLGLGDRPFLLCLGRVEHGKGTTLLTDLFAAYKERRPSSLALVLAGPVHHEPAPHPDVILAGTVDEATKWGLLRGAQALVSPSAYESFSIVLLEAWSVGTPALVNGLCEVTADHARQSEAGFAFTSYATFEATLDHVLSSAELRTELGENGVKYVAHRYRWPDLVERYAALLDAVAERRAHR